MKWFIKCFIYWTADLKSSKLWSSQLWTQFKQLRIEAWKSQDFNGVWTCDLAIPVRHSDQLSYEATDNCHDHSLLDFKSAVQYMKHLMYHLRWLPTVLPVCTSEEGWRTKNELLVSPLGLSAWHSQWRLVTHLGFLFHQYEYVADCCHGNRQS